MRTAVHSRRLKSRLVRRGNTAGPFLSPGCTPPQRPELFDSAGAVPGIMVVGERENLNFPLVNFLQNLNPLTQVRGSVHDDLVPSFCLLLDSLSVADPAHIGKI